MNQVVLLGNLCTDVRIYQLDKGGHVKAEFRLASSRPRFAAASRQPTFIDVAAWGQLAIACHKYLVKGERVLVRGQLVFREFQSTRETRPNSGKPALKRYMYIRAEEVTFLGCPRPCCRRGRGQPERDQPLPLSENEQALGPI